MIIRSLLLALVGSTGIALGAVPENSLVKVRALAADGEVKWGSGVVIAPERLATTCHVTRRATTIEILRGGERWIARAQQGSATHDLCVLTVEGLRLPAVHMRAARDVALGERVTAVGFEHGGRSLVAHAGTVKGQYVYDDGMVIRTSAAFDFGSSGGGLFDAAGNLVGFLAFRARTGDDLRFALPSEWLVPGSVVRAGFTPIDAASPSQAAFWEGSAADRPAFLGAALRESREHQ